jgi:hypothetical protein
MTKKGSSVPVRKNASDPPAPNKKPSRGLKTREEVGGKSEGTICERASKRAKLFFYKNLPSMHNIPGRGGEEV